MAACAATSVKRIQMWQLLTRSSTFRLCGISTMPCRPDQIPFTTTVSIQQVTKANIQCTVRLAWNMQQSHILSRSQTQHVLNLHHFTINNIMYVVKTLHSFIFFYFSLICLISFIFNRVYLQINNKVCQHDWPRVQVRSSFCSRINCCCWSTSSSLWMLLFLMAFRASSRNFIRQLAANINNQTLIGNDNEGLMWKLTCQVVQKPLRFMTLLPTAKWV